MLQFEEYITTSFKIYLKICVICKSIKIKILIRKNQSTYKESTDTIKGTMKNTRKSDNKNKTKDANANKEKKNKTVGLPPKKKDSGPSTTLTQGKTRERRRFTNIITEHLQVLAYG